ncbi:fibroleukin-like [Saccostrea cucullata]|uniref:fibroleukin-like n=1 Tax=Saccostrea cuccullata TaxID=36930 RepID=UPI002ED5695A
MSAIPLDCKDLYEDSKTSSGVYNIYPDCTITSSVQAFCDMTTMGGGWTAIQKRVTGSLSFDRYWTEYKNGFGLPEQDFWVGNDFIHLLTKENNSSLYVSITLLNGTTLYEMYDRFSVSDEAGKYQLFLAGPATGTLGDSMLSYNLSGMFFSTPDRDSMLSYNLSGIFFSTPDRDNDWSPGNCAAHSNIRGGWWFNWCHWAFLNVQWSPEYWESPWYPTVQNGTSVNGTTMMIKRY